MAKKAGRPPKKASAKKTETYLLKMRPDFAERLDNFAELTGMSKAKILRTGAADFINRWHLKRQRIREAEKAMNSQG